MTSSLVVRYAAMFDGSSDSPRDKERLAEFAFSLLSLKKNVAAYIPCHIVIYTASEFRPRLQWLMELTGHENVSFVGLRTTQTERLAGALQNLTAIDRICVMRLLTDFTRLDTLTDSRSPRLLVGTDIYFLRPPVEVLKFVSNGRTREREPTVLYMIDNFNFRGLPYRLRYWSGQLIPGLLGDFYCVDPGVRLEGAEIEKTLRIIDEWPRADRWVPRPPRGMKDLVHACDQQAASILLARYRSQQLPSKRYQHWAPNGQTDVLHGITPWVHAHKRMVPDELANAAVTLWRTLGYHEYAELASGPRAGVTQLLRERARAALWVRIRR